MQSFLRIFTMRDLSCYESNTSHLRNACGFLGAYCLFTLHVFNYSVEIYIVVDFTRNGTSEFHATLLKQMRSYIEDTNISADQFK